MPGVYTLAINGSHASCHGFLVENSSTPRAIAAGADSVLLSNQFRLKEVRAWVRHGPHRAEAGRGAVGGPVAGFIYVCG